VLLSATLEEEVVDLEVKQLESKAPRNTATIDH